MRVVVGIISTPTQRRTKLRETLMSSHRRRRDRGVVNAFVRRDQSFASSIHSGANASSDTRTHTLARHRDVAKVFNHEFRRMKDYIEQEREHASLLQGRHRGNTW